MDGLLGLDFLVAVAAKIDLGSMTLTMCRKQAPGKNAGNSTVYPVILMQDQECPGYTRVPAAATYAKGRLLVMTPWCSKAF